MPRIQTLTFTANYRTVADVMKDMLKNPVVSEGEDVGGYPMITVEGDFERFILEDMDIWRERLRFEIKDFTIKDSDDRESRAFLAENMPGFGAVLFSPTVAYVYRRVAYKTITSTVVERVEDEKRTVIRRDVQESEEQEEWTDCTGEFGSKIKPVY